MSNVKPLYTAEQLQQQKEIWWDNFDDINLSVSNLNCALECAYQRQYEDKDFDGWIIDKIREDMVKLHQRIEAFKDKAFD